MKRVDIVKLPMKVVDLWMNQWLLLTAGTMDECNMMTVAWGSIGYMWNKPFAQIVVRPQRYTHVFTEKSDSFTLCAFPESFREDLNTMGTFSGRDTNKLAKTSLSLRPSTQVKAPSYNEASLILECRKLYSQKIDPAGFADSAIQSNYPSNDYHTVYFGEIVAAFAE